MGFLKDVSGRLGIAGEMIVFLWEIKQWWLIPMMVILLLFGIVIVVTQSSALGPFIYTLF